MMKIKIYLNTFEKIKDFINITYRLDCNLNLTSGKYIVDGKSIIGIFNLDLSNPIEVSITNDKQDNNYCLKELEAFII